MNTNCKALLALVLSLSMLFSTAPAWAHRGHDHGHDHDTPIELEEIPADGMTADQYRQLLDDAHHSIEDETPGNFLQRWREKFRFKKFFLNSYRWYSMHKDQPHVGNSAANIAGMLITSHTIETVGGMAMASAGVANGLEGPLDWALMTVGVTITIPFLDPLCLILVGAYGKWPKTMDRLLTVPRLFLVHGPRMLLGIPEGFVQGQIAERAKNKFLEEFSKAESLTVRAESKELEFRVYGAHEGQTIDLKMERAQGGGMALHSVTFSEKAPAIGRTYLKQLLQPFGFNIREFVLEIDQAISDGNFANMAKPAYVDHLDVTDGVRTVFVKDGAFRFHAVEESDLKCESYLQ